MLSVRRADRSKRDQIRKVRQECLDAGLGEQETFFRQVQKVRGTLLEHTWAKYFLICGNHVPDTKMTSFFRKEMREWNKSNKNQDMEIIGVPDEFQTVHGQDHGVWILQLAKGQAAIKAAEMSHQRSTGEKEKEKRLLIISKDKNIEQKIRNYEKELERKIKASQRRNKN